MNREKKWKNSSQSKMHELFEKIDFGFVFLLVIVHAKFFFFTPLLRECYHNRASWTTYLLSYEIGKSLEKIKIVLFELFESCEVLLYVFNVENHNKSTTIHKQFFACLMSVSKWMWIHILHISPSQFLQSLLWDYKTLQLVSWSSFFWNCLFEDIRTTFINKQLNMPEVCDNGLPS